MTDERQHDPAAAFARFARTRAARDFAVAYDATAQDLLIVATRLAPRGAIEDLLQATWLHAIRRAATFDGRRPLLPWLIGILVREVRMQRRTFGRRSRHEVVGGAADDVAAAAATPTDAAELAEFARDASDALARLDATHRQVLVLRLAHGLTSFEIGRALGRPAHTVRSQLARGLDKLRRLLPAGHALPAALVVDVPQMVLVRAQLMAGLGTSAGAVSFLGVLVMKKVLLVTAAAVVAGVAVWMAAPRDSHAPELDTPEQRSEAVAIAPAELDRPAAPPPRVAVDTTPAVSGRVVDAMGAPVEGVIVSLVPLPRGHAIEQRTGADGRFRLAGDRGAARGFHLELSGDSVGGLVTPPVPCPPTQSFALGDVIVEIGTEVRLRVVDNGGAPVERLAVMVDPVVATSSRRSSGPDALQFHAPTNRGSSTLAGGVARLGRLPAGEIRLRPGERDTTFDPDRFVLTLHEREREVQVVLRRTAVPEITGVVVDERGLPVRRATVEAVDAAGPARVQVGSDGRFRIALPRDATPVPVTLVATAEGFEPTRSDPIAWGTADARLALQRSPAIEFVVRDGTTGMPLEAFGVRHMRISAAGFVSSQEQRLRHDGPHPGGVVRIALPRGEHAISFETESGELAPSPWLRFEVADVAPPARVVELFPVGDVSITVVDDLGAVVAGSLVELLDSPFGEQPGIGGGLPTVVDRATPERVHTRFLAYRHAASTTDVDGRGVLRAPRGEGFVVRITGAHESTLVRDVRVAPGVPLRFVVARGAIVEGTVRGGGFVDEGGAESGRRHAFVRTVTLVRPRPPIELFPREPTAPVTIAADGTFRFVGVPAGDWDLCMATGFDGQPTKGHVRVVVASVRGLGAGERRSLTVDLTPFAPSTVDCRIVWNDGSPAGLVVSAGGGVQPIGADGRVAVPRIGDRGECEVRGLRRDVMPMAVTFDLGALTSAAGNVVLHVRTGPLTLELRDDADRPAAHRRLRLTPEATTSGRSHPFVVGTSDAAGRVHVAHVPQGTWRVEQSVDDDWPTLGRVVVTAGGATATLRVR